MYGPTFNVAASIEIFINRNKGLAGQKQNCTKTTRSSVSSSESLKNIVVEALKDLKADNISTLDVKNVSSFTDYMLVAGGRSARHVNALVEHVRIIAKQTGQVLIGVEGQDPGDWVLVDLGDVVVHVMQREARQLYDLERLWSGIAEHELNN